MKTIIILICYLLFSVTVFFGQENLPEKTIVTPYMNHKILLDTNVIYCGTFQIAWDELKKTVDGNVILDIQPPMSDSLNNGIQAEKYINQEDYYVKSGVGTKQFISELNNDLRKKFKGVFNPVDDIPSSLSYIIYAFLYKNLKFKQEYEKIDDGIYFIPFKQEVTKIRAFGINSYKNNSLKHKRLKNQTEIHTTSTDELAVVLNPKKSSDQIILSEIYVSDSLSFVDAYFHIMNLIKNHPTIEYSKNLSLNIPVVNFDLNNSYNELIGKYIKNNAFNGYKIIQAYQTILFKLDEKGAVVKSKAKIKGYRSVSFSPHGYLKISFNRPFFIILKEKNSLYPYMIIWVANPSLLENKSY